VRSWNGCDPQEFDVLLVDDYLPDLHACEFLSRVGQLPVQPWIVVMQASLPTTDDLLRYASLGAFSVVRKHHLAEVFRNPIMMPLIIGPTTPRSSVDAGFRQSFGRAAR